MRNLLDRNASTWLEALPLQYHQVIFFAFFFSLSPVYSLSLFYLLGIFFIKFYVNLVHLFHEGPKAQEGVFQSGGVASRVDFSASFSFKFDRRQNLRTP